MQPDVVHIVLIWLFTISIELSVAYLFISTVRRTEKRGLGVSSEDQKNQPK